ncbi:hypothetical protein TNCV_257311 [Trichonephila clavipes]|nr:hypothetical protein TNCV_257311 [Trichonephila clavipes]
MEQSSPSLEPILPFQTIVLIVLLSRIVSKRKTHLAHSFLMSKFSDNMRCTTLFEMPTISASSSIFSQRPSSTALWIFFAFLLESSPHLVDHCDSRLGSSYGLV